MLELPCERAKRLAIRLLDCSATVFSQAASCEERLRLRREGGPHHCPSYIHCFLFDGFPVCPIEVRAALLEIKEKVKEL